MRLQQKYNICIALQTNYWVAVVTYDVATAVRLVYTDYRARRDYCVIT